MGSVECIKPDYIQELHSESAQYEKSSWMSNRKLLSYLFAIKSAHALIHYWSGDTAHFVLLIWRLLCLECFSEFLNMEKTSQKFVKKKQHGNNSSFIFMIEDSWSLDVQDICVSNLQFCAPFPYVLCWLRVWAVKRRYTRRHNECAPLRKSLTQVYYHSYNRARHASAWHIVKVIK